MISAGLKNLMHLPIAIGRDLVTRMNQIEYTFFLLNSRKYISFLSS